MHNRSCERVVYQLLAGLLCMALFSFMLVPLLFLCCCLIFERLGGLSQKAVRLPGRLLAQGARFEPCFQQLPDLEDLHPCPPALVASTPPLCPAERRRDGARERNPVETGEENGENRLGRQGVQMTWKNMDGLFSVALFRFLVVRD